MRKFGITFWFYAKEHFTKKSLIILGVFLALTVGGLFAFDHFGGQASTANVALVQESSTFVIDTDLLLELPYTDFWFIDTEDDARELLDDGEVDDIFIIQGMDRPELTIITSSLQPNSVVQGTLMQLLTGKHLEQMMALYELPVELVLELSTPIEIHAEFAEFEDFIAVEIINTIVPIMILMLVSLTGQMVANSVAAEKSSRVMEVMLGKVHPTVTMITKVLSSLLGIVLPIVMIVLGVVVSQVLNFVDLGMVVDIINEFFSVDALILSFVVLILGYFCFIFLFAAAGAIANSVESLASTLTPVLYLTMAPYFAALFLPIGGAILDIGVYVPFITPFVIVQRFILGYSNMVEVAISLAGMVLFACLMLWVSARLYMNGISHNSEKLTMKDLRKMLQK